MNRGMLEIRKLSIELKKELMNFGNYQLDRLKFYNLIIINKMYKCQFMILDLIGQFKKLTKL